MTANANDDNDNESRNSVAPQTPLSRDACAHCQQAIAPGLGATLFTRSGPLRLHTACVQHATIMRLLGLGSPPPRQPRRGGNGE